MDFLSGLNMVRPRVLTPELHSDGEGHQMADSGDVLRFWYEECTAEQWFKKDAAFDATIRDRFGDLHAVASAGGCDDWAETPEGSLALVLVLDQFSRNLYRDDPRAFAQDAKALDIARRALAAGHDQAYPAGQRYFYYLPYEHSEDLRDQEESVALFEKHGDAHTLDYAIAHRDIIARFGRFPHRNAVLGRESTAEEEEFLQTPGSSF